MVLSSSLYGFLLHGALPLFLQVPLPICFVSLPFRLWMFLRCLVILGGGDIEHIEQRVPKMPHGSFTGGSNLRCGVIRWDPSLGLEAPQHKHLYVSALGPVSSERNPPTSHKGPGGG